MSSRQGVMKSIVLLLVVSLFLVACERPLQDAGDAVDEAATRAAEELEELDGEEPPEETVAPEPEEADDAVATEGETPEPTEAPEVTPTEAPPTVEEDDASPRTGDDEEAEAEEPPEAEEPADAEEPAAEEEAEAEAPAEEEAAAEEETAAEEEAAAAEEAAAEEAAAEEAEATEAEVAGQERVHVVQPGENLYRIGLQYGVSWVVLAEYNGITNPNSIYTGQQIRIPPGEDDDGAAPTVTPTPSPSTETTYVVQPGDNLYRIGRAYGVSWTQIAEANGLVNPNQIYVGQELKIPTEAPGPAPQFTHTVQPRETLFRISLRYGVPWTTIAEANDLTSPYVIYPGQTLVIPGG